MKLFDKIPSNFFTVLSRKYKSVYAFALMVLFDCLKTYKTQIKRVDYIQALRKQGSQMMELFDVDVDRLDDAPSDIVKVENDENALNYKTNYIFRKLVQTGWVDVEKDVKTNIDMLYLPPYSIRMMKLLEELSSDINLYVPLVHQTYSELSLEDEKEDDYMFRSLVSARKNADELELNVTLLHHSICVFGHNLAGVFDPNEALHQHFDIFREQIGDRLYHPMKTYDSLSLYALPVTNILKRWQRDKRIMAKLVSQAKFDPAYSKTKASDVYDIVSRTITEIVDIYNKLTSSFEDIDKANAKYTQAVQKKVNFLSNADKTIKGKLDSIILYMAKALDKLPMDYHGDYMDIEAVQKASDTINLYRQGIVNSDSLTMPFRRNEKIEQEPLPLEDEIFGDDDDFLAAIQEDVQRFSQDAIEKFMLDNFKEAKVIETKDIVIDDLDDFVLLMLATVRAQFGDMFYRIEKIGDTLINNHFSMPNYRFTRKGR